MNMIADSHDVGNEVTTTGYCINDSIGNTVTMTRLAKRHAVKMRVIGDGIDKVADLVKVNANGRQAWAGVKSYVLYDAKTGVCLSNESLRIVSGH